MKPVPKHLVFSFVFGSFKAWCWVFEKQVFSIIGTDFIVLFCPDVSCHSASAKGLVIFIEYCQLSDAKSKMQQFHVIYLLFWCCQLSVAIIAKGSFSFVLVIFIVMNTASCQMPKVKWLWRFSPNFQLPKRKHQSGMLYKTLRPLKVADSRGNKKP